MRIGSYKIKVCLWIVIAKAIFEALGIIAICIAGCAILSNLHLYTSTTYDCNGYASKVNSSQYLENLGRVFSREIIRLPGENLIPRDNFTAFGIRGPETFVYT